jgi:hypothetical protein
MLMFFAVRVIPFLLVLSAEAQPYLNLDFETSSRGVLWYWSTSTSGYEYVLDTTQVKSARFDILS